jgi:hypothetical protein
VILSSENGKYDPVFITNYATINVAHAGEACIAIPASRCTCTFSLAGRRADRPPLPGHCSHGIVPDSRGDRLLKQLRSHLPPYGPERSIRPSDGGPQQLISGAHASFLLDGLVSGIRNHRRSRAARATAAMPRKPAARPKLPATRPESVVLSEAPIPDIVPTKPCARLNRPVALVRSATISAVSTPSIVPLTPSSI